MKLKRLKEIFVENKLSQDDMYLECDNNDNAKRFIVNFYEVYKFLFTKVSERWTVSIVKEMTITDRSMKIIKKMRELAEKLSAEKT